MGRQRRRPAVVQHIAELDQRPPTVEVKADQHAGDGVGEVVVAAGRMIDRVAPAARGSSLQASELGRQARQIEKLDPSLVETEDPNAFRLSVAKPMRTWRRLMTCGASRRDGKKLVAELRRELPGTTQADQILKAIDQGSSEDMA